MKEIAGHGDGSRIFGVLRAAALLAGLLGTMLALLLAEFGLFALGAKPFGPDNVAGAAGLAAVAAASVCCWGALLSFYRLCGRLREGRAFTGENAAAMRRIARLLLGAGCAVLAGTAAVGLLTRGLTVSLVVTGAFALAFFGASLLSYALALLVCRAAALQQDQDLTV